MKIDTMLKVINDRIEVHRNIQRCYENNGQEELVSDLKDLIKELEYVKALMIDEYKNEVI